MLLSDLVRKTIESANIITREVAAPKKSASKGTPVKLSLSDIKIVKFKKVPSGFKCELNLHKTLAKPGTQAARDKYAAKLKAIGEILLSEFKTTVRRKTKELYIYEIRAGESVTPAKALAGLKSKLTASINKYNKANGFTVTSKPTTKDTKEKKVRAMDIVAAIKSGGGAKSLGLTDKEALEIVSKALSRSVAASRPKLRRLTK